MSPPEDALVFDVNTGADTLEITHSGGDALTAVRVFVTDDRLDQEGYWQ